MNIGIGFDLRYIGLGKSLISYLFSRFNKTSIIPAVGSLISFTSGGGYFKNSDGYYQLLPTNVPKFTGARVVINLARYTEDLSNAVWVKTNCTPSGTTLTADAANATCLQTWTGVNDKAVYRVDIQRVTGTGDIDLTVDGGTTWTTITLSGVEETFSIAQSAVTNSAFGVRIVTSGDEITFDKHQLQDKISYVTAQQVIPDEYVSVDVLSSPYHGAVVDGVKFFSTENGNTVSGNVVTEATGAALSTLEGLLIEPTITNNITYARDFSTWGTVLSPVLTQDQNGIDNAENTATTLEDNNTAGYEYITHSLAIANDNATHYKSIFILKDSDISRYPEIQLRLSGGTEQYIGVQLNTETGSTNVRLNVGTVDHVVKDEGLWWWMGVQVTNNTSGNTTAEFKVYPAVTAALGTTQVSATGSIVIDCAQDGELFPTPILTSGAALSMIKSDLRDSYPAGVVNNIKLSATFKPIRTDYSAVICIVCLYTNSTNYLAILHDGTKFIVRKRVSTIYDATYTLALDYDAEYVIEGTYHDVDGIGITVNSAAGTGHANTIDFTEPTRIQTGSLNGVGNFVSGHVYSVGIATL